jgi:diacylglycerol kinase (ATP)
MAGVGFDTVVTRFANEQVRWVHGSLAYAWALLRCLRFYRPHRLEIASESQDFSGDVIFAVIGNNVAYGGGLKMCPRARLDDGLLDVCIIPAMEKFELLQWVPRAYRGNHLAHPRIIYFQARRISLKSPARLEILGTVNSFRNCPPPSR